MEVRRTIELDRLKMEKISKEREGEWDWGERVAKAGCAVSRLLVWTKERYFGANYTLYQGLCRPY